MTAGTAGARLSFELTLRSRLGEVLRSAVLMFSAAGFATIQFVSHAMPSPDIVYVPTQVILYTVAAAIFLPALILLVIDRAVVSNDESGAWTRRYRAGVLAVASVLVLRQLQLYFGPAESLFAAFGVLQVAVFFAAASGIVYAVVRWFEPVRQFYSAAAPVVAIFALITIVQMTQIYDLPSGYAAETPDGPADKPPVFVIVADELSYDVLAQGDDIDAAMYPNLAALAADSAWFTDASTNHVHTTFVVPRLVDATTSIEDDYQIRLYSQYAWVEHLMWEDCGTTFTCRGAAHLSQAHQPELTGSILRRALFQATPGALERTIAPWTAWMDGGLHTPPPNVDGLGMHTFTTEGFETFLADVDRETAPGSVYFYHVLLPHAPMVFSAEGAIRTSGGIDDSWENYADQTAYFDSLIGRFTDRLKAEGIYDDAVILITGDHGRRPYEIQGKDFSDSPPEVPGIMPHVPLLIYSPAVEPGVYDTNYQHQDFGATFLDALGRDPTAGTGISAFAEDRPNRDKVFFIDQHNERYWRYVYNPTTGEWDFAEFVDAPLPPDAAPSDPH